MLKKKLIYGISIVIITIFIFVVIVSNYALAKVNTNEVRKKVEVSKTKYIKTNEDVENEIRLGYLTYKQKQKSTNTKRDLLMTNFIRNVNISNKVNQQELNAIWQMAINWVTKDKLYDINNINLKNVINSLKTVKITYAHIYPRGTQLKLLLLLEGNQKALFKPQWYSKEELITGKVYAGYDRYGAEILAFYLSGILNMPLAPIATERIINVNEEIFPVATKVLLDTSYQKNNVSCIYGKCFYCTKDNPVCEKTPGKMHGAIILHIPGKFIGYRSPWQRTYQKGKKALWEYVENYCHRVKQQLPRNILLDLIDTAIFDFLIQNGDRHHYETLHDKVILFDNGKGLGNPNIHHLDILAPLYQCCMLRTKTFERLTILFQGELANILKSVTDVFNVVTDQHLNAIQERIVYILVTIDRCKKENKLLLY